MAARDGVFLRWGNKTYPDPEDGLRALAKHLKTIWGHEVEKGKAALKEYLDMVAEDMLEKHSGQWPGGTTATSLSRRSGEGIASIINSVRVVGTRWDQLRGYIGGSPEIMVHEFGATMGGRGKLLTIPLPAALDSNGLPIKKSARDWENTFVAESKAGNTIIFQKRGTQIIPLYVLKDRVTIRPRLGLRDDMRARLPYFMERTVDMIAVDMVQKIQEGH